MKLIYITNTDAIVTLSGVEVTNNDSANVLIRVSGNDGSLGWGRAGSNGASARVILSGDMTISGDIVVDSISSLELIIRNGVTYNGRVRTTANAAGGRPGANQVRVTVEDGAVWNQGDGSISITGFTTSR